MCWVSYRRSFLCIVCESQSFIFTLLLFSCISLLLLYMSSHQLVRDCCVWLTARGVTLWLQLVWVIYTISKHLIVGYDEMNILTNQFTPQPDLPSRQEDKRKSFSVVILHVLWIYLYEVIHSLASPVHMKPFNQVLLKCPSRKWMQKFTSTTKSWNFIQPHHFMNLRKCKERERRGAAKEPGMDRVH